MNTTLTFDEASGAWWAIFPLCFTTSPVSPDGEVDTTGGDGEERDLSLETHVALLCWGGVIEVLGISRCACVRGRSRKRNRSSLENNFWQWCF